MTVNISIDPTRCKRCGMCAKMCPNGALTRDASLRIIVHAERLAGCPECGLCLTVCPRKAIRGAGIAPAGFPAVAQGLLATIRRRLGEMMSGARTMRGADVGSILPHEIPASRHFIQPSVETRK